LWLNVENGWSENCGLEDEMNFSERLADLSSRTGLCKMLGYCKTSQTNQAALSAKQNEAERNAKTSSAEPEERQTEI